MAGLAIHHAVVALFFTTIVLAVVSKPEAKEKENDDHEGSEDSQTLGVLSEKERDAKEDQGHKEEQVSYTHLRAHETVLELEGRLLLENKKEKAR